MKFKSLIIVLLSLCITLNAQIVSTNGIATNNATGLVWQDDSEAKTNEKDWKSAKAYCENLTLGGYEDWRLPNIYELSTLLDNTKSKEPYVKDGIKNIVADNYWSSKEKNDYHSFFIDFLYGKKDSFNKVNDSYVRCVTTENKPKVIAPVEPTIKENIQKETIISKKESNQSIFSDSATGLVWQDDSEAKTNKKDWNGAKSYCENLTLGGYSDWRLPNIFELTTLLDNTKSEKPYIVNNIKNITSTIYFSSTPDRYQGNSVWTVNFYNGNSDYNNGWDNKTHSYYVRCVRGEQLNFDSLLEKNKKIKVSRENVMKISKQESKSSNPNVNTEVISKSEIFTDNATGLVWQDNSEAKTNKKDWNGAKSYCENLTLGGYSDWRLPNIFELITLLDNTKSKEPYVVDGIKNIDSSSNYYWSSTTYSENMNSAWFVYFYYGNDDTNYKVTDAYVRCVSGKTLNFDDLSLLKKSGKIKVSQENIDSIKP